MPCNAAIVGAEYTIQNLRNLAQQEELSLLRAKVARLALAEERRTR